VLAQALWPGTTEEFVEQSQRYQGISDRLQLEVLRRHGNLAGFCLTELTDVPHELNGLLDLRRRPKVPAIEEVRRAQQPVLPMLDFRSLVVEAGARVQAALHVANDGPALRGAVVDVDGTRVEVGDLRAHDPTEAGEVGLAAPAEPGQWRVRARLTAGDVVAENEYTLRVAAPPGDVDRGGLFVVEEDALDGSASAEVTRRLDAGETVLMLAQPWESGPLWPTGARLKEVETRWGSTAFTFTTGDGGLSGFPDGAILIGEDATFHATAALVDLGGRAFPEQPLVIRYNPQGTLGTLVGVQAVGAGRLVFCQYRVARRVEAGDLAARVLLADLLRIADA
jgi:hypothetical protein